MTLPPTPPADRFAHWAEAVRAGDRGAFAALYDATHDPLYRYTRTITRDDEAAADVLQDVFVKLWSVRHTLDPARSLRALLFGMVRNAALNRLRADRRRPFDPLGDDDPAAPAPDAADALAAGDLARALRAWIDALPPRRREAFTLSRFEGLTHEEIAAVMDLAPKTVNNHIVLALQTLRGRLAAYDPDVLRDDG